MHTGIRLLEPHICSGVYLPAQMEIHEKIGAYLEYIDEFIPWIPQLCLGICEVGIIIHKKQYSILFVSYLISPLKNQLHSLFR